MNKITRLIFYTILIFFNNSLSATADIILPSVMASNMVLQRNQKVKIWGWADKNEKIKIIPSWLPHEYAVLAGEDGKWLIELQTLKAGGPHSLIIKGKNEIILENIMFGEVWLCSGQSNMVFSIKMLGGWDSDNFIDDKKDFERNNYSDIRVFDVVMDTSSVPLNNCGGGWEVTSLENVENSSAVAWFFGRELYKKLKIPIGLITTDWRGTGAEAWINPEAIECNPDLSFYYNRKFMFPWHERETRIYNSLPGILYNSMIHPLLNCRIKGVIWYQGEKNCPDARHYHQLFPAMIQNWREDFGQGDFPFFYVQIAPYDYGKLYIAALLREAQFMTLCYSRNTGMAVTLDIGNPNNVHPKNKQDVGKRLARIAFAKTYGFTEEVYSGPVLKRIEIVKVPGKLSVNGIRVHFDHVHGGLVLEEGEMNNFIISGPERNFLPANKKIEGESILLWNDEITEPVAVRYAFFDTAKSSLFNKHRLPASSFRTDDWPVLNIQDNEE